MKHEDDSRGVGESGGDHVHGAVRGIVCNHILRGERQVNLVCHLPDGTWDFMCGEDDGHDRAEDASVVCVGCAFGKLVTGLDHDDLPAGHVAERPGPGKRWVIRPLNADEMLDLEED